MKDRTKKRKTTNKKEQIIGRNKWLKRMDKNNERINWKKKMNKQKKIKQNQTKEQRNGRKNKNK